ncbi:MAG: hypothetical protein L0226_11755 [Acidobacteria bacterium]|nr:hypothetical protein [Acidobacteriota bacterium]
MEKRQDLSQTIAKLRSCVPDDKDGKEVTKLNLAVAEVVNNTNETAVRIVVYAIDEAVDFDFPVYSLSRGRWLINEKGRAYLLDEQCREYKLKDRRSMSGQAIPLDGRISLNPGQAFEALLSFPRLSDQTQMGVLVYGDQAFPFSLWAKSQ